MSRNALGRLERGAVQRPNIVLLGQLFRFFASQLSEAFPERDAYDHIFPPKTIGGWIKNQRLRRALGLRQLARRLRVHAYSLIRYERDSYRPDPAVWRRLREALGPGIDVFHKPATILNGARSRPTSAIGRTERSARHAAKKQAVAEVQLRSRRG